MKKPSARQSKPVSTSKVDPVKVVGQFVDFGKEIVSSIGGVMTEKERTRQKQLDAAASIASEQEKTKRVVVEGYVAIERIRADSDKHKEEADVQMVRALADRDRQASISRQEERILDAVLSDEKDRAQLAQNYRTLINNRDR